MQFRFVSGYALRHTAKPFISISPSGAAFGATEPLYTLRLGMTTGQGTTPSHTRQYANVRNKVLECKLSAKQGIVAVRTRRNVGTRDTSNFIVAVFYRTGYCTGSMIRSRTPFEFLQRKIDKVRLGNQPQHCDHAAATASLPVRRFSGLAKHGNLSRFCRHIQQSQTGIERPHRDEILCWDSRPFGTLRAGSRLSGGPGVSGRQPRRSSLKSKS